MSRILRYLACLFMLIFVGNALAAGYSCPSYKQYTSCNSGYYMTASSSSTTCNTTPRAGNACRPCSLMGSNYTCPGGTSCPELNEVTITYDLNGGSGTKPSAKTCTPGTSCSLASGATTSFYRAGYVFKGWSTSSTATSGSTSITFNANDTVYAVWSACAAGTYKAGSGTQASASCRACSGRTKYQNSTGQSSCKTVSSGYYTTGCNTSGNSCTGQSQCTGATYCSGGVQNSCPAQTSGWTRNTGTGWTSYTQCNQTRSASSASEYCRSGTLKQNATSATTWGTTTVSSTLYADVGSYVNGTTCTQCQKGYVCPGGAAERKACDGSLQYQDQVGQRTCKLVGKGYYKSSNSAQAQCPANYRDGTAAANINNCKTSCVDGTYVATAKAACTSVGTGYYRAEHTVNYGSTSTRNQCPANYRNGAAAANIDGCKTSCDDGEYVATANAACTSVGTGYYRAAHTVNYGSTSTRNQCPTNYRNGAAAANIDGCKTSCAGGTYVATANAACTSVGTGYYRAAHTVNYGSTSTRNQCPSGYRNGAAAANQNSCIGNFKKTGSQVNGSVPTNCSSVTSWNSCTPGTCTYQKNYAGTITSDCTPSNCTKTPAAVTAKSNFYVDGTSCDACPSGYPLSDGGNISSAYCYVTKKKTGSQVNGSIPTNCKSVTSWNSCTPGTCTYRDYQSATDTTCTPSNCTKTPAAVTAKAGYYDAGTSCSACPSAYPNSADGNEGGNSKCYMSVPGGEYVSSPKATTTSTCVGGTYKGAHNVYYGSTSSCTVCGTNQYSDDGAASCTGCKTSAGYGNSGTSASSHDGVASCKVTCDAGEYVPTAGGGCVAVGSGYYKTGTMTVAQNATNSTRSACSGLSGVSVSGGTYTSVSPYNASTTCRYKAPAKTITGCASVTSSTVSYSGSAWPATTYTVSANPGYYISNTGTASATCVQCQAGYACAGGTTARDACDAQTQYQNQAGQSSCKTVSSGYYKVDNTQQKQCTGATYCSGGVQHSCPAQTSGWTRNTGTGWTSYTQCNQTRSATAVSSYCSAGQLKQNATSATGWGASTISTAFQAKAGAYVNGQTCSQCASGDYCTGGTAAPKDCPSGYPNSDAGAGAITLCYSNSKSRAWTGSQTACAKPTGCYSVTCNACSEPACSYVAYANNAGTGDGTIKSGCSSNNKACQQTVNTVTANAGRYVSGKTCPACAVGTAQGTNGSTATSCSVCSGNTYAASTGMATCSACPSGYSISGTAASNHDAKSDCKISCAAGTRVTAADAACTTPTGSWYTAAHTVAAGSTTPTATIKSCLTNYVTPNTSTRTDHDASNDCKISCAAGTRITTVNATSCTTPAGNWYIGAHSVAQGSTSSVNTCLTNYTISGTAASNHDAASDCKISCGGGSYIAAANNTSCSAVGAGYWAAASTVSQGSAGVRNQCDEGLTTIGSGAGADEVGDCGRVLNVNGEKIYLRSTKKTTPSLNVSISGTTFYGNMGASSIGSLKLKSDGTTYSVYDDSMQ